VASSRRSELGTIALAVPLEAKARGAFMKIAAIYGLLDALIGRRISGSRFDRQLSRK
jgi:hypothetical protein